MSTEAHSGAEITGLGMDLYQPQVLKVPLPMAQVVGVDHVVQFVNPAFCQLLGKPATDLVGKPFASLVPDGHDCLTMLEEVYRTGAARSHVLERVDIADPVYWSYTCLPVKGEGPEPQGVVVQVTETPAFNARAVEMNQALLLGAVRQHELAETAERLNQDLQQEVAEHQRAEELLRKNRDTFADLIEKAPFGLYVVDAQSRLYQVSSGSKKVFANIKPLLGRDFGEVLAKIWSTDVVREVLGHFRHTLDTGEPYVAPVFTQERVDNREVESYDWRIERLSLPDGGYGVVCYFYDISEQRRSRDQLLEADQRKSEFLAMLAHELRNPLAPLRNGLELLATDRLDRATFDQAHGMMNRQLDQMVRLIDELLDLSRITRGTIDLMLEQVDLNAVLYQAVENSRSLVDQNDHTLVIELPHEQLITTGDGMRLAQVFNNLLNNAAKYTPRGGTITVHAEVQGGEALISVCDTGVGIAKEDQSRVFDMFAQVLGKDRHVQGGLGIGLNIVKHLVDLHGGRITVQSDGPQQGSCFTVHLPMAGAALPGATVIAPPFPVATAAVRTRVLIVDDNEDAANMMALLLGKWGHEVFVAQEGSEALSVGDQVHPDIVIMDIGMPVMDGHTACEHMRRTPWGKAAFIVALTGWGQEEDKRRSQQAGFDHHLVKPAGREALRSVLKMARTHVRSGG